MKLSIISPIAAALVLTGCATDRVAPRDRGEARLAAMLAGRVAGEPRSCISAFDANRMQVIDQTAIVYDAGKTIWVSRPSDPKSLNSDDIVVIKRTGSQLCKQDVIRTVDRVNHFTTGVVFLGDFVPYEER